ncbi:transposase [Microvirga sp. VF16]|uniref:transposase n=1 Tax=Microvirga sp. VF16 TaxID=2807101 RepID=UPI001FEDE3DA|nr:transposase [Microvirga sp. VF16]
MRAVEGGSSIRQAVFAREYQQRIRIEGTISVGVRVLHLRRSRYVGRAKTHVQHVLTAAAMNLIRIGAWLSGAALARTRQPHSPSSWRFQSAHEAFASSIAFEPRLAASSLAE